MFSSASLDRIVRLAGVKKLDAGLLVGLECGRDTSKAMEVVLATLQRALDLANGRGAIRWRSLLNLNDSGSSSVVGCDLLEELAPSPCARVLVTCSIVFEARALAVGILAMEVFEEDCCCLLEGILMAKLFAGDGKVRFSLS